MKINIEYLDLLPEELLSIIFSYVKPSIKYTLNKILFNKYYKYRLHYVNNNRIKYYNSNNSICDCYIIKNLNYIKYLINYDNSLVLNNILSYKIKNDKSKFIINKKLKFENTKFNNFIDFCYFYSNKYNSFKIKLLVDNIIKYYSKDYKVIIHSKNNYKNIKNKNIRWSA
tara:strand:+ start:247 stop:756 length:510 start_codon:yes stop_codon:yes gene_type:complete